MSLWELEMEDRPETVGQRLAMWEAALRATGPCDREAAECALRGLYNATPDLEFFYTFVPSPVVMFFAGGFAAGIRQLHALGAVHYEPGNTTPTVLRGLERAAEIAGHAVMKRCPAASFEGIAEAIIAAVREVTRELRWPEPDQVAFNMARSCLGEELVAMVDGVIAENSILTDWPAPRPGFGGLATTEQRMRVLCSGSPGWRWGLSCWDLAEYLATKVYGRVGRAILSAPGIACSLEQEGGPLAEHVAFLMRAAMRCLAVVELDAASGIFPVFESASVLHDHRRQGLCLRMKACRSHHELAMAAGPQFHHEGFCILCDRPVKIHVPRTAIRSGRPCMRWSDGTFA